MTEAQHFVSVGWAQRPFAGPYRQRTIDAAARIPTIAEIVGDIPLEELPRGFAELGEARVNGELVPRGLWHLVRPRYRPDHETVVTLHVPLQGPSGGGSSSGGSGKSSLALVASIAVLLVAAAVSGGALGLPGIGLLSAATISSIAGAAIGTGGTLETSALEPRT